VDNIFEVKDKTGRIISLYKKEWNHIVWYHADVANTIELIRETIMDPLCINPDLDNENVWTYHRRYKEKEEYLVVVVKYLNGKGFIITSFWSKNLKQ